MSEHQTVLLEEAVSALVCNPAGRVVDCTYGRGGHSQRIAETIGPDGRLMVMDQDVEAVHDARRRFAGDARITVVHGSFAELARHVDEHSFRPLDGILLDLGVSSPQLDVAERGFSFMGDGPLDMRMDQTTGQTASEWLASAPQADIVNVLRRYGEEKFARRIAQHIVDYRESSDISTTATLVKIIEAAVPRREKHKHPATRSFQAIRIFINQELAALESCLGDVVDLLVSGGRLVVISFHSLEDRMVKRFIRDMVRGDEPPPGVPVRDADIQRYMKALGKAIKPGDAEVQRNRRARSSIMRVAEKL